MKIPKMIFLRLLRNFKSENCFAVPIYQRIVAFLLLLGKLSKLLSPIFWFEKWNFLYKNDIYVANRGHNSISKLSFDGRKLKFLNAFYCKGKTPRDFIFHENRIICANQDSNSVTIFEEESNGKYKFIQQIDMDEPICVICGKEE